MGYKTDYIGHDRLYQDRKVKGFLGWDQTGQWQVWRTEIERLIAEPFFPKQGSVLELGSGAGDVSLLFAEKGYRVSGIEISPTAVAWAREKAAKHGLQAEFVEGNVMDLSHWDENSFDAVTDGHCLHCIIGDDRAKVFSESFRVLKRGGLLYVSTMCGDPTEPEVRKQYDPESRCMVGNGIARRYFGKPEDILNELSTAGFSIQRHEVRSNPGTQDDLIVWANK
jgi:ubiquinone/menaquinone biosynthesis C-methylase UbiE